MTKNRKEQRAVRERAAQEGKSYTQVLREMREEKAKEGNDEERGRSSDHRA